MQTTEPQYYTTRTPQKPETADGAGTGGARSIRRDEERGRTEMTAAPRVEEEEEEEGG